MAAVLRPEQRPHPGRADPPDVLAEVDEHRQLGADLDHRRERGARVTPAEQLGEDPQVRAAGDRQELGQPLEGAEDDGLEEVHHRPQPYGYRSAHAAALPGRTGLKVSRLGLGTLTWGRDTDEHEARDQLISFAEAGGTLVDTAAGYGDGASEELIAHPDRRRRRPRRDRDRHQGRHLPQPRRAARPTSPAATCSRTLDASLKRLGVDHVDLWQVHTWVDDTPLEETLSALDHAVTTGRASYVGVSNYSGWQTAQAATWQRAVPGRATLASTQVEYSLLNRDVEHEVLPAADRARARRAALVAAGPRRADRQVPHRHARRDSRAASPHFAELRRAATSTTAPRGSSRRSPGPPTASAGRRSRWPWSGCATGPGVTAPIVGRPHRRPAARPRSASRS